MSQSAPINEFSSSSSRPRVKLHGRFLKYILLICLAAVLLAIGYTAYAIVSEPRAEAKNVQVTNITARSATITWQTDDATKGVVVVNETGKFKPGLLATIEDGLFYDDRDRSTQELASALLTREAADKSAGTDVKYETVKEVLTPHIVNRYYVHHVTVSNLNPEQTYYFSVGNGYIYSRDDQMMFSTFSEMESLLLPDPAYGMVTRPDKSMTNQVPVTDALVYLTVKTGDGTQTSTLLSAVVSHEGTWYIDLSTTKNEATGESFWRNLNTMELNRLVEEISVVSVQYGEKSREISALADAPAMPFVLTQDADGLLPASVSGASDECTADNTEGLACLMKYTQEDPYLSGDGCGYSCNAKGYCNGSHECVNEWLTGSYCRITDLSCESVCEGGSRCFEGQICSDGSSPDCCLGECEWVYQESGSSTRGESLLSASIGTASSLYSSNNGLLASSDTLGLFDELISPAEAASCACNDCCGEGWQGPDEWCKCWSETETGKSKECGCVGSGSEDGNVPVNNGENIASCYCENKDAQGNWINCHFSESEVAVVVPTCKRIAEETGVEQQLWCRNPNPSASSNEDENLQIAQQVSLFGQAAVLSAQAGSVTCNSGCENVGDCNNPCIKKTPTPTDTFVCCQYYPRVGLGTRRWELASSCNSGGGHPLPGVGQNNCTFDNAPPTDETVCCESSGLTGGKTYASVAASQCTGQGKTILQGASANECNVCCKTPTEDIGRSVPKDECEPGYVSDWSKCEANSSSIVGGGEESSCDIQLGELCTCLLCNCPEDTVGKDKIVTLNAICSLGLGDCSEKDASGNYVNDGKPCVRLIPGGTKRGTVCDSGTCALPVSVGAPLASLSKNLRPKRTFLSLFLRDVFAQDSEEVVVNDSIIMVPELGIYSLGLGKDYYAEGIEVGSAEGLPIFVYVERNNDLGYQQGEDEKLDVSAYEISLVKTASLVSYELRAGFNMVSFPLIIDSVEGAVTASTLLTYLNSTYDDAFYSIATFDSGRWLITENRGGNTYGTEDFQIVPGKGYVLKAKTDIGLSLTGKYVADPVPTALISGWNLIGIHGADEDYTAASMIKSIDNTGTVDADNVTRWRTDLSRYDGLQVDIDSGGNTQEYGFDFPMSPLDGYFVRVTEGNGIWIPE